MFLLIVSLVSKVLIPFLSGLYYYISLCVIGALSPCLNPLSIGSLLLRNRRGSGRLPRPVLIPFLSGLYYY